MTFSLFEKKNKTEGTPYGMPSYAQCQRSLLSIGPQVTPFAAAETTAVGKNLAVICFNISSETWLSSWTCGHHLQLYLNNHYLHLRFDIFCLVHDINLLLLYNHFNFVLVAHVRHSQTCLPLHSLNHNFLAIYNIHTALLHGGHFATHEVIDDYWLLAIGCWLHVVN